MKNAITTLALLAASSALASAATTTVDLVTLAGTTATCLGGYSQTSTSLGASDGTSGTVSVTATDVGTYLGNAISGSSFLYGSGTLDSSAATTNGSTLAVSPTITDGTVSFSIWARAASWYGGWAALVIAVDDILAEDANATIDDLTSISYTFSATQDATTLTAWVVTGTTATELTVSNGTIDVSAATEGSYIVLLVSNPTTSTTSAITLSATTVIPEPSAFGLLAGVGALALVGARCRASPPHAQGVIRLSDKDLLIC